MEQKINDIKSIFFSIRSRYYKKIKYYKKSYGDISHAIELIVAIIKRYLLNEQKFEILHILKVEILNFLYFIF